MSIIYLVFLFIFGAIFGSFACCQARRLHLHAENQKDPGPRSVCLHCGYQLRWRDNIPIFSYLFLRGRCRHCHKSIGLSEFIAELATAIAFVLVGLRFGLPAGLNLIPFVLNLTLIVLFAILAVYDANYQHLPTAILNASIFVAFFIYLSNFAIAIISNSPATPSLLSLLGALAILPLPYFLLYKLSHESLVGGGDYLLALAIAFALGDWWLALCEMFLANFLACLAALPTLKTRKTKTKIPLGPFLIIAFIIISAFAKNLLIFSGF